MAESPHPITLSDRRGGSTARARVYANLRDAIVRAELAPGRQLSENELAASLGVSRTPVREALLELSFEGLVRVAPRSGVTVIGISPGDVLDSFTILGVLTGQAAAWAAQRVEPDELAMLRELADDVASRSGDDSIGEANWLFHQRIHRAAHSPRLMTQIKQAARVVPTNFLTLFPEHEKHSLDDHRELLDAFAAKDVDGARAIAERHVLDAGRSLVEWLKGRD